MGSVLNILFTGDLNPHWAGFPAHIIMYFLAFLLGVINIFLYVFLRITSVIHNTAGFFIFLKSQSAYYTAFSYFIGRLAMAMLGSLTLYFVYAIGKKLFNSYVGIIASLCLAIAPLHVLHSKIIRPDIATTAMILMAFYCLYAFDDKKNNKNLMISCYLFAGFAIAAKYTSGLVIIPILIYCLTADNRERGILNLRYISDFFKLETNSSRALFYIFFAFFITSPFVFLDLRQTLMNLAIEARSEHVGQERLAGIQNHIWYIKGVLINGIGGLFFALLAFLGLLLVLIRKSYRNYIFFLFPLVYYAAIVGFGNLRFYRWLIPILPFEALLFGIGSYAVYKYVITFSSAKLYKKIVAAVSILILIAASLPVITHNINKDIILTKKDTRTTAKEWIEKNIPENARIAAEDDTPQLMVLPKRRFFLMTVGTAIVNYPIEFYVKNNIDYVILTRNLKKFVYEEPVRYKIPIERYDKLAREAELIKIFDFNDNPGPVLEIYKLKH